MKERRLLRKLNNEGSSLVTVIVVVAFICVLGTIILYVAGSNYLMKLTDRRNKENFYKAETAMEEVKAGLALVASEASAQAYLETMVLYSVDDNYTRYNCFQRNYLNAIDKAIEDKSLSQTGSSPEEKLTAFIQSLVEDEYKSCVRITPIYDAGGALKYTDDAEIDDGYLFLRNIEVVYVTGNYSSVINTDFVFTVPELNWAVNESYKDAVGGDGVTGELHGTEAPDKRDEYNISEFVNYVNWSKN